MRRSSAVAKGVPMSSAVGSMTDMPKNMTEIKRLKYLSDAREAKVQAVLDEALSWLIAPFSDSGVCEAEEHVAEAHAAHVAPASLLQAHSKLIGLMCSDPSTQISPTELLPEASPASSPAPKSFALVSSDLGDLHFEGDTSPTKVQEAGLVGENMSPPASEQSAVSHSGEVSFGAPDTKTLETNPSEGVHTGQHDQPQEESEPLASALLSSLSFPTEELQKLDLDTAWEELDAHDSWHACDMYFPLLTRLLAAGPASRGLSSAQQTQQTRRGAGVVGPVSFPQASVQAVDSPKRKRGRPKGSGKKAKLEKAKVEGPGGALLVPQPLDTCEVQAAPAAVLDLHFSASSALTNSPTSLRSTGSADNLPPLADLTDVSADSLGPAPALNSVLRLPSPATPSSSSSLFLRSCSAASSSSAAGPNEDPTCFQSARSSTRSSRLVSNLQARRLMFGGDDESSEEAGAAFKEPKKSMKVKTGRPRGRPRKVRPHEHMCPGPVDLP